MTEKLHLVPGDRVAGQIDAIFAAWGMAEEARRSAVTVMVETDLRGIDSHGIAMLIRYEELMRDGRLNMRPAQRVVRESPVTALIDADGGLGYHPSITAMAMAVDKAKRLGVATVGVYNTNHYGAAGAYAMRAAAAGVIGVTGTGSRTRCVVPTRARDAMFATNPIAFAAPARRNPPFVLDMATSTVAVGKVNLCWLNHRAVPAGWVVDGQAEPIVDATVARDFIFNRIEGGVTPLGGLPAMASHKGYGLAAMIEILSTTLTGAIYSATAEGNPRAAGPYHNIGHFFMAIDPKAFRDDGAFEDELDDMIDALRAARPVDPALPVLVPGDPERAQFAKRSAEGIPVPAKLVDLVRAIAGRAGAPFLLEPATVA